MARIPENNPRYRTKTEICQDVAKVLNSKLAYGTKYAVVNQVNWVWTEYHGKYRGCPYWSLAAIQLYEATSKVKGLKHEHVVPKKVINQMIFELQEHATPEAVRNIYDSCLIGVVVSSEEDQRLNKCHSKDMPPAFDDPNSSDYRNPWLRYKLCGIPVTYMRHAILKILPKKDLANERVRHRLMKNLYRHHWIDTEFDWKKWDEGKKLQVEQIAGLDCDTIKKLFTLHFRQDHYCEGHLDAMYASGHIAAILQRLQSILESKESLVDFDGQAVD